MNFEPTPATQGRILLVDDDEDTRATLSEALHDLGFEVETRGDGAAGLEQAAQQSFDVVLTDLKMPKMDGIELCQRLSGERPQLPVVVMTAFGDLESALAALRAGAFDFIIKPFTVEQVAEALRRARKHAADSSLVVRSSDGQTIQKKGDGASPRHRESLEEVERQHIMLVLDAVSWNKAEAARTLGIDRATLYRKLRRYGIDAPS
jgi:DNA-binding NtrC family response regulator